jgi:hypothetical protein
VQERLQELSIPEPNSGCWLWLGRLNEWGYGVFRENGKTTLAHRSSWIAENGEIPKGMLACHLCDIPACINPEHLWLGTDLDNSSDCIKKGRNRQLAGGKHPNASMTEDQAKEAIFLISKRDDGEIAEIIGCTKNAVNLIRRNRTWRHLAR